MALPPRPTRALAPAGLLLALVTAIAAIAPAGHAATTETQSGSYVWDDGNARGALTATFTETDQGQWKVAFDFRFDGRPHTYTGTATGSLTDGDLTGRVTTEDRRRTFSFRGKVRDGKFTGTHAEVFAGGEERTGTLVLEP